MATLIENFKENKKAMEVKSEMALRLADEIASLVDDYVHDFLEKFTSLVENASEEEFKAFIESKDEAIDENDKFIAIVTYAKKHDYGVCVIGK